MNPKITKQKKGIEQLSQQKPIVKLAVCVLILLVLIAAGYFIDIQRLNANYKKINGQIKSLTAQNTVLEATLRNQLILKTQVLTLAKYLTTLINKTPKQTNIADLIKQFHQSGAQNQIQFLAIQPQSVNVSPTIILLPIKLTIEGSYHNVAKFIDAISNLSIPLVVLDFSINNDEKNSKALEAKLIVATYQPNAPEQRLAIAKQEVKDINLSDALLASTLSVPAPPIIKAENYQQAKQRDPFKSSSEGTTRYAHVILREVPLSKIKLVGTMINADKKWAIIMPEEGKDDKIHYKVVMGERISQAQAKIIDISKGEMRLSRDIGYGKNRHQEVTTLKAAGLESDEDRTSQQ